MTEAHLNAVAALEQECFSHPWSLESLRQEMYAVGSCFLVAEQNGAIVGYAGMTTVLDEASVTNVAVSATCRRQGIGRKLIQAQKSYCIAHEMAFLTLEVRASNRAAIALYESEHFTPVGKRPRYYSDPTEDAILMTCFFES